MLMKQFIAGAVAPFLLVACSKATAPSQVIYRFDDHRYFELVGYNCEGALIYHDPKRNINSVLIDGIFAKYRLFTKTYIHPSERYMVVTDWYAKSFLVSKDYGQTWQPAGYSTSAPPYPEIGTDGNEQTTPSGEYIENITVVNDQGFILTKQGHLYMSSKPFDDPRTLPGGPGVDYTYIDDNGSVVKTRLEARAPGPDWGLSFVTKYQNNLENLTFTHKAEYQDLPDKIPEIKNYKGWTKMQCDMNAGIKK